MSTGSLAECLRGEVDEVLKFSLSQNWFIFRLVGVRSFLSLSDVVDDFDDGMSMSLNPLQMKQS